MPCSHRNSSSDFCSSCPVLLTYWSWLSSFKYPYFSHSHPQNIFTMSIPGRTRFNPFFFQRARILFPRFPWYDYCQMLFMLPKSNLITNGFGLSGETPRIAIAEATMSRTVRGGERASNEQERKRSVVLLGSNNRKSLRRSRNPCSAMGEDIKTFPAFQERLVLLVHVNHKEKERALSAKEPSNFLLINHIPLI